MTGINWTGINWTTKLLNKIKKENTNETLYDIYIPGSHNSGTKGNYLMYYTQDLSITEQLEIGIRYFDFRLNDELYISHLIPIIKFDNILVDLHLFLLNNPSEIIIVNVSPDINQTLNYTTIIDKFNEYNINTLWLSGVKYPLKYYDYNNTIIIDDYNTGIWLNEFVRYKWIDKFNNISFDNYNNISFNIEDFNKLDAVFTYDYRYYILMIALILVTSLIGIFLRKIFLTASIVGVLIFVTLCNVWIYNDIMINIIINNVIPKIIELDIGCIISYDYVNEKMNKQIISLNF